MLHRLTRSSEAETAETFAAEEAPWPSFTCYSVKGWSKTPIRLWFDRASWKKKEKILRYVITGSLDHSHRLYKSNLISSPICPHCNTNDETAEHIFWYCSRWKHVRDKYPTLLRLFSFMGTQWPNCFSHRGWIEQDFNYGISLLHDIGLPYTLSCLAHDTHHMFLQILLARHTATQVLRSTPATPPHLPHNPLSPQTTLSSPSSCVQLPGDVSPISLMSSPG